MALSAFADKAQQPGRCDLEAVLGPAYAAWNALIEAVSSQVPELNELWGFTSRSTGWGLRLRHGDRVILYMTPSTGHFLVSFALGEKAVERAKSSKLPKWLLAAINSAPRYVEGRGLRVTVTEPGQVPALAALARIKHQS